MAIAIDRELVGDINNPSFEVLNFCMEEHEKEIPRLQMLFDYYVGKPHKEGESPTKTPHDLDEIYVNNAKYVTDMMTGFAVGNPISYTAPKGKDITPITEALDKMKINKHDKEMEKGLSSLGHGLELHYLSVIPDTNETVPRVAWIDPRGMFLVVDDTVDRNPLFAVRPRKKRDLSRSEFWEVTVYTPLWVIIYRSKNKKLVESELLSPPIIKEHFYGDVPVVEFRNNEEKQGDYEQQLSQIDGYNLLQTDRIKDKRNFVKAIMVMFGFGLPKEKPIEINGTMAVQAPAKNEGADLQYAVNTFDESQVQILADSLLDDFHKTVYIPNLNDENFAGNISGEAMKFKVLGLLLALAVKTGYFEDGVMRRLKLLGNILRVKGQNIDTEGITIKFKVNLPFNRKDIIEQIRDSQEFIPLLISLGWLDDIDNPQEVIDLLNEQREKEIELKNKIIGSQAEDKKESHNNLDDTPEED